MSAKPEVMQLVMEKLAIPAWLRRMPGFIKGKPWHAWGGEARAAGAVRAHQHAGRYLRDMPNQKGLGHSLEAVRGNLARVSDPRHRRILTQGYERGAGYVHPSLHTNPQVRAQQVQDLMSGPSKLNKRQAVRYAAGIPMKSLPMPSGQVQAFAPDRFMRHVVPPKGGTGVFEAMYAQAPSRLQQSPRFADALEVVKARKMGVPTISPRGIQLPPRMQYNTGGHPLLNLPPPTRTFL